MKGAAVEVALTELAGAVVVLDRDLRIVSASSAVEPLLGEKLHAGDRAVAVLCGEGHKQPIAEALAAGRPAAGTVVRPRPGKPDFAVRIRARPLPHDSGWLLQMSDGSADVDGGDVVNFHGIITADAAMKRVLHVARRAAATDVTVLVRGETGTGKELLARALHALSPRASGPFRAINCAALSPALLESELFGHVRGAFTGAVRDSPGHFRHADGGTLFLDEIAEMPAELQAKLLRVIETGAVTPVGAMDPVVVDVRIVAATHKSLRSEVAADRFRADLMYRLRKVPLFLPPLRQRAGDIIILVDHIVAGLNLRGLRSVEHIAPDALRVLERYEWPGNIRELANALEYAFVVGDGPTLVPTDLPPEILEPGQAPDAISVPEINAPTAVAIESSEEQRIARALERAAGHRGRAAHLLGWSRATLWRRMKKLGMLDSARS